MPLLLVAIAVLCLLILIMAFRLNAFIALVIVAIGLGIAEGMTLKATLISVQSGIGGMLGSLVMILGFGAMLGKLLVDSGAVQRITYSLLEKFGVKHIRWAVMLAGFLVGLPMYYMAGFVLLVPLIFSIANSTKLPILYVGIPMIAALSVTHGYLPPHPGPTAISIMFGANMAYTLLFGIIIAIPAILVAGLLFSNFLKNLNPVPLKDFLAPKQFSDTEMPGFGISLFTVLVPVLLMTIGGIASLFLAKDSAARNSMEFISEPNIAMMISVLVAVYTLGLKQRRGLKEIMDSLSVSVTGIAMILLVLGGGGALKQVLVDSGVGIYITELFSGTHYSPLILAWAITGILRISLGSSTVSALTAGGVVLPLMDSTMVSPELMVLAIGAGSLICSHVNDPGFWIFKEYFNLSVSQTLSTWTVMETLVSVIGLFGILILNAIGV
jgi:gluconate transporter